MKNVLSLSLAAVLLTFASTASAADKPAKKADKAEKAPAPAASKNPVVVMKTSMGEITLELNQEKAPITTKNFLRYVDEKFYDGTIFHRVINGFMIQGGGLTKDMNEKTTHEPIKNESSNGLKNDRGTIAMARMPDPNSATAQFFINVVDNNSLNYPSNGGYAVFGKVISGMDVVDKIKAVPTGVAKNGMPNSPATPVVIESVRVKK
jgi:cyclophilin family peptidyl-prolyl cis-trans isomerase